MNMRGENLPAPEPARTAYTGPGPAPAVLPTPPPGKSGWPWDVSGCAVPPRMADGACWPKTRIVTPSFNQGRYLEATIRSVLLQGIPGLEYVIMDGGSTDESEAIIHKYAPWLSSWEIARDRGQSHAINKGLLTGGGDVLGWMNSDDLFLPGGLRAILELRAHRPDARAWAGGCRYDYADGRASRLVEPRVTTKSGLAAWGLGGYIPQPGCLFDASSFRQLGGLDESLHYALDVDLWLKLIALGPIATMVTPVAVAYMHPDAKSERDVGPRDAEVIAVTVRHGEMTAAVSVLERHVRRAIRAHEKQAVPSAHRHSWGGRLRGLATRWRGGGPHADAG